MTSTRPEATFDVTASPAAAWKALDSLRVRASEPDEWWLPGFECRAVELEVEHERRLSVRKLDQPCVDTVIDITFEHSPTGARIRIVQSGFDETFVERAGDEFWAHADLLFAGVRAFFESV